MKKFQSILRSTPSASCRSIRAMLTPFLSVLFLLGFLNVGNAQTCPPPSPPECEDLDRSAEFNLASLWGGTETDCLVRIPYKERTCLSNIIGFDVFGMEMDESKWLNFDPTSDCAKAYFKYKNSVATKTKADIDKFDIKMQLLFSEVALRNSAGIHLANNQGQFICPLNFLTGKFYFGTCAVSCMRWEEKIILKPGDDPTATTGVFFLKTTRIPCGANCCTSTQRFCREALTNALISQPPTLSSDGSCNKSTPVKGCEQKWGYFGKSNCITACDFDPTSLKAAQLEQDDIASVDMVSQKGIKVNVQNNSTTKIISVAFINSFKGAISLFDVSGKQVFSTNTDADSGSYIQIETNNFSTGIYLLSLQSEQNTVVTEKILIK